MTVVDTLAERNDDFARTRFIPGLPMLPRLRTLVVGCVDPRVDPAHVLGLETGDAAVIRNVGGRVTPDVLAELALLGRLARSLVGSAAPVASTTSASQDGRCSLLRALMTLRNSGCLRTSRFLPITSNSSWSSPIKRRWV